MKPFIIISLLLFSIADLFSQAPSLIGTPTNNLSGNTVSMYEKFEIDLKLSRTVPQDYKTPHDSDEVSLIAYFFNSQSQHSFRLNFFYNEPYVEQTNPCTWPSNKKPDAMFPNSSFTTTGNSVNNYLQSWKMRCAFRETGTWNYTISAKDKYAPDSLVKLYSGTVNVTAAHPNNNGFIRTSTTNNTYLFFDNGKMCFLNGVNEFFAENKETFICRMKALIDKMTDNNINFMRMWIDGNPGWYYTADIQGEALNDNYCTSIFNQRTAKVLDEIIEYARLKNMYIQPCLYAPCLTDEGWNKGFTYHNAFNINNPKHNTQRNNIPNVGEITNPWDFFNPSILKYMRNYIKYCTSRWGYATNIVGWEIGNELNPSNASYSVLGVTSPFNQPAQFSQQLVEWHKNFKKYLNYYDAHQHLVTTSLQSASGRSAWKKYPVTDEVYNIFSLMDYSNSHNYYINPTCPEKSKCEKLEEQEDANFLTNITYHEVIGKPTQVQEWGLGDDKCNPNIPDRGYYELDPFGVSHHNMILSSAFAGSMGTACTFNTWADVQPCDYYYHYKGLGQFMNKFGNLGNPLYVKKSRTNFDNKGNSQCSNTDFSAEGLRSYYMANSDKLVIGWCQDKRFSFARLYWRDIDNNLQYLKTFESRFKPSTENSPNTFDIKVPQKGYYKMSWYHPLDLNKFIQKDIIVRSFSPIASTEQVIRMNLPKALHNDKFADGLFSLQYICEQKLNFAIPAGHSYHYGDKIPIQLYEFAAIDEVELSVEHVNEKGQFIETLFKKLMSAGDFKDSSKRELNYLYNTTKPALHNIPFYNNQTTYYKLRITPTNPNNLSGCTLTSSSDPVDFQIAGCNSIPKLKINGIQGSSFSNPVTVAHGAPITLDCKGSVGGTGYRIIIREVDNFNNYTGLEYNVKHDGITDKTFDASTIVQEATNGVQQYLPSDGTNHYRIYQIYHVNFNSYLPYRGCSSWEATSEFVKVTCTSDINLKIVGGGSGPIKEFAYAEEVLLDGRSSTGETGYRIIIQPTDPSGNYIGKEFNKRFVGNIDKTIDLNSIIDELSSGTFKYLPPDKNGPAYYKVYLVIYNGYGDGGCETWKADSIKIKINSCHITNAFTVNKDPDGNSFTNPYSYVHGDSITLDGLITKGETGYRLTINRLNPNGNYLNTYMAEYSHPLTEIYDLNKWYKKHADSTSNILPSFEGSKQNIWKIQLMAFNTRNDEGCDDSIEKNLYFVTLNDLKCDFILNSENTQNQQNNMIELCDDEGTFLNPIIMNYGSDKYTIVMDELESATWQTGTPKPWITYERSIKNQPQYINRKRTSESFLSPIIGTVNLEDFWLRRTGYKIDKTKHYKVTLITNDNVNNCSNSLIFNYKSCLNRPQKINPKNPDQVKIRQATKLSEITTKEEHDESKIKIYPNPTSSFVNITIFEFLEMDAKIEIFDMCSKKIYSGSSSEYNVGIDLSSFNDGIYFIKVTLNNTLYNYKIIKLCD